MNGPDPTEDWIFVARIVRPRGIRGEVLADGATANPERFLHFPRIELRFPDPQQPSRLRQPSRAVKAESVWAHQDRLVFKLEGVDTVEQAEALRETELWIPRADRPPAPEGEFYFDDLIGCEVVEQSTGESLGKVTDCLEYGGPLLLEVMAGEREILIPFVPEICVEKNVAAKRIVVVLPEGLKDL